MRRKIPVSLRILWVSALIAAYWAGTAVAVEPGWRKANVRTARSPSPRTDACIAFDPKRGRVVLVGGRCSDGHCKDVWEWDGSSWHERVASGGTPAVCRSGSLAWHPERETVVMHGVKNPFTNMQKVGTYEWDGSAWSPVVGSPAFSPRIYPGMAYHRDAGRMILHGGLDVVTPKTAANIPPDDACRSPARIRLPIGTPSTDETQAVVFNDTWALEEGSWKQVKTSCDPLPRFPAAGRRMWYETRITAVVTGFGWYEDSGIHSGIYQWAGSDWEVVSPGMPPDPPGVGRRLALARDRGRNRTLVFGGRPIDDGYEFVDEPPPAKLWQWRGEKWTLVSSGSDDLHPPGLVGASMAYDSKRNDMVLFGGREDIGGQGPLNRQTWLYRTANSKDSDGPSPSRPSGSDGGCACRITTSGSPSWWALFFLLIGLSRVANRHAGAQ